MSVFFPVIVEIIISCCQVPRSPLPTLDLERATFQLSLKKIMAGSEARDLCSQYPVGLEGIRPNGRTKQCFLAATQNRRNLKSNMQ